MNFPMNRLKSLRMVYKLVLRPSYAAEETLRKPKNSVSYLKLFEDVIAQIFVKSGVTFVQRICHHETLHFKNMEKIIRFVQNPPDTRPHHSIETILT
jgi:hypothetical protein